MGWRKKNTAGKGADRNKLTEQQKIGGSLNFQAAEAYKLLRTNLEFSFADDKKCKIIGITSALSGEGKSLTTINIAYAIAANDKKVLVLEADFRKPTVASKLGLNENVGLTDLLVNHEIAPGDILVGVRMSELVKFDLAPTGRIPPNPAELLDSNKMKGFLEICSENYDYILIDLPPITVVADAVIASKHIDGMVVVVRQDRCDQKALNETMRQLKFSHTKVLGFVFNGYNQAKLGYYKKHAYQKNYEADYVKASPSLPQG
ncbi:MAG: CpsD/CapB family tyrosine-protein kinase [Acetobacterium sp.]|uniref:CpsD/CapB family tyrosine-protein kinase n=1 Tax=Acetobacterium sp. TaxID=1872094 RepID=UPI0032428B68